MEILKLIIQLILPKCSQRNLQQGYTVPVLTADTPPMYTVAVAPQMTAPQAQPIIQPWVFNNRSNKCIDYCIWRKKATTKNPGNFGIFEWHSYMFQKMKLSLLEHFNGAFWVFKHYKSAYTKQNLFGAPQQGIVMKPKRNIFQTFIIFWY